VLLTTQTNYGCIDTISKFIKVLPQANIGFNINNSNQCLLNLGVADTFKFTNTTTGGSGTLSYSWNFGDGSTAVTGTNVSKTYTTAGSFKVVLTVTGSTCTDTLSKWVTVFPKPVVGFTANNLVQCFTNHTFNFTNTSSISSGTLSYIWNFGDASAAVSTTSPSKTYAASGIYKVLLTTTSSKGCADSISKFVKLHPKATTGFSINNSKQCLKSGLTTNSFSFTNSSSISVGTLTYSWDFGDGLGNTSATASPTYVYSSAGIYKVVLKTTTSNGCDDTISKWVVVYPKTTPSFTVNLLKQCLLGNAFTFTNTSSIGQIGRAHV
jgi:PKD repeat protein